MNKKPLRIALTKIDIALLIFCLYGFIRMVLTPNTPLLNTRFLTLAMLLGLYFFWKYLFSPAIAGSGFNPTWPARPPGAVGQSRKQPQTNEKLFLLIILLVGMGQAIYGLLQLYNILPVPPNIGGFKVFGNFGNPAPYGSFLGPFIPLSLGVYLLTPEDAKTAAFSFNNLLKNAGLITFLLTLLVIPATNSRSAWVGAIVGMGIVLEYKYSLFQKFHIFFITEKETANTKHNVSIHPNRKVSSGDIQKRQLIHPQKDGSGQKSSRTLRPLRLSIFIILLLSIILSGSIFLYNYKKDSAFGRVLQWKVTANMIKDKPVFGHGFNSYGLHYNTYQADYFAAAERPEQEKLIAGNNEYGHCDYLEILTELGITGLVLFILIIFTIFRIYIYMYKKQQSVTIIVFAGLLAYLVECLFTFPLHILPSLVILVGLLSLFDQRTVITCSISKHRRSWQSLKFLNNLTLSNMVLKIIAIILVISVVAMAYTQYKKYNINKRWNLANYYSSIQQYEISENIYKQLYLNLKTDGDYLLNYGGTLTLYGKYAEAIPILNEARKYISDPNLYINIANCYKETNNYKNAEKYYQLAEKIVPHQMYQKYLLAKLYNKYNKIELFNSKAEEILNMKIKINSRAIYEIKNEIKNMLGKLNNE